MSVLTYTRDIKVMGFDVDSLTHKISKTLLDISKLNNKEVCVSSINVYFSISTKLVEKEDYFDEDDFWLDVATGRWRG